MGGNASSPEEEEEYKKAKRVVLSNSRRDSQNVSLDVIPEHPYED